MNELWNALRSLGVLKPEYDRPLGSFGTGLERDLEMALYYRTHPPDEETLDGGDEETEQAAE